MVRLREPAPAFDSLFASVDYTRRFDRRIDLISKARRRSLGFFAYLLNRGILLFLRSARFLFQTPARAVMERTSARVSTDSKIVVCTILDSLMRSKFSSFRSGKRRAARNQ